MSSSNEISTSPLGHAILALIGRRPRSGYDLTCVFAETPLNLFSESPGAIYPALKRLEAAGLIRGTVEKGDSLRPRKKYSPTARGRGVIEAWLRAPIDPVEVRKKPGALSLRFSFMDQYVNRAVVNAFLEAYIKEHLEHRGELIAHRKTSKQRLSTTGRLALDMAIAEVDTRVRWARRALRHLDD